jgi:hypothetical protein
MAANPKRAGTMGVTSSQILAAANLAAIAYTDEGEPQNQKADMAAALKALDASANGPWALTWGPADNDGVLAYVAQGADGTYALAFRGSLTDDDAEGFFENWFNDVGGVSLVPWLYPQTAGANVAAGNNAALALAIGLTDPTTDVGLVDYLRSVALQNGGSITLSVCGHSLGGAMTTLAAAWLADQLPKVPGVSATITPLTFAAPSIGDATFAALYKQLFGNASYAAVNSQDIVPMAWTNVAGIINAYASFVTNAQTLKEYSWSGWVIASGIEVAVAGKYTSLTPSDLDTFTGPAVSATDTWPDNAANQHSMSDTYLPHVQNEVGAAAVHA